MKEEIPISLSPSITFTLNRNILWLSEAVQDNRSLKKEEEPKTLREKV